MANKAHKLLTGTDLHEPKGIEVQPAGKVYVSDGAGSGSWVTINTDVTASTGDVKLTYKTVADTGWILHNDGDTIRLSGTATYVGSVYQALYYLFWGAQSASIAGGRGGSAAADWAANKALTLPPVAGRTLAVKGPSLSGLTNWALGQITGTETVALSVSNLPSFTVTGSVSGSTSTTSVVGIRATNDGSGTGYQAVVPSGQGPLGDSTTSVISTSTTTASFTGNPVGSNVAHSNIQPTMFLNIMIKV